MKSLYESILDDELDVMDKADKSAEMFLLWDTLNKGLNRKYNAAQVKRNIKDAIKKYDLLPHDDEWSQIVKQLNTDLGTKCVEEAPIKYELRVISSLNTRRANRPFYSVVIECYWRTYYKKNGELIKQSSQNASGIISIMEFSYDPLATKPRVIQAGVTSDTKWAKRLADRFNKKPEFDDKGNCQFVL